MKEDHDVLFSLILVAIVGVFLALSLLIFEKYGMPATLLFVYMVPSTYFLVRTILE